MVHNRDRSEAAEDRQDADCFWRLFWIILLVAVAVMLAPFWARAAQIEARELPTFLCKMALGNVEGALQEQADLFVETYVDKNGEFALGDYGLLTGLYYGDRGSSGHGPTLESPQRYYADGSEAKNWHTAWLRSHTADFRQTKCQEAEPK